MASPGGGATTLGGGTPDTGCVMPFRLNSIPALHAATTHTGLGKTRCTRDEHIGGSSRPDDGNNNDDHLNKLTANSM